eukprot:CAMPEP_0181225936 /NCGR_PEP_ID=MMETSP1096-20121128/31977_1 /TAXON_ID=156174 ORGANISM="Chrysochromulina ericina, Strain CCMP281" /NCGR_SAMPLE_ID=MMETSP1096 /ASSEMBLY_ACC=CAM_ASM_000453 /LENGTH=286 /DNA_ID=CAMNT_0023319221 /DNA_START=130 /DNA_END=990 /DNA_ORIENTATION=-
MDMASAALRRVWPVAGVWYNIGKSVTFADHGDAFAHFNAFDNEAMCRAAAAAGFDTVQFTAHPDHVNYPCDTVGNYPYMNIEIVAVKLQGSYACGSNAKPDFNVLRSGWADQPCACDNSIRFSNCGRALRPIAKETGNAMFPHGIRGAPRRAVPADCSSTNATDPPWFSSCSVDGACIRVGLTASIQTLVLAGNSTSGANSTVGFDWCVDSTNNVAYAKLAAAPSSSVAFFSVQDDATGRSCRFLAHHWVDGDLVRVYQQNGLSCTLDWTQLAQPDGITKATLKVA